MATHLLEVGKRMLSEEAVRCSLDIMRVGARSRVYVIEGCVARGKLHEFPPSPSTRTADQAFPQSPHPRHSSTSYP
jgi:hypothetical protein